MNAMISRACLGALLIASVCVAACGRSPTAPALTVARAASSVGTSCTATQRIVFVDRGLTYTLVLTAHYTVCPSDAALAAAGWTRVP